LLILRQVIRATTAHNPDNAPDIRQISRIFLNCRNNKTRMTDKNKEFVDLMVRKAEEPPREPEPNTSRPDVKEIEELTNNLRKDYVEKLR